MQFLVPYNYTGNVECAAENLPVLTCARWQPEETETAFSRPPVFRAIDQSTRVEAAAGRALCFCCAAEGLSDVRQKA